MSNIRPTKKQRELLAFIEQFIQEHGYSPSYREVMNGLQYNSVATVALHINNLITRGHLRKRDHSARSLEVVAHTDGAQGATEMSGGDHVSWLYDRMLDHIQQRLQEADDIEDVIADGQILTETLAMLGYREQANGLQQHVSQHATGSV